MIINSKLYLPKYNKSKGQKDVKVTLHINCSKIMFFLISKMWYKLNTDVNTWKLFIMQLRQAGVSTKKTLTIRT